MYHDLTTILGVTDQQCYGPAVLGRREGEVVKAYERNIPEEHEFALQTRIIIIKSKDIHFLLLR